MAKAVRGRKPKSNASKRQEAAADMMTEKSKTRRRLSDDEKRQFLEEYDNAPRGQKEPVLERWNIPSATYASNFRKQLGLAPARAKKGATSVSASGKGALGKDLERLADMLEQGPQIAGELRSLAGIMSSPLVRDALELQRLRRKEQEQAQQEDQDEDET